nr:hypothetical protein Iba_chr02bCG5890 [Ipomoea batatas]
MILNTGIAAIHCKNPAPFCLQARTGGKGRGLHMQSHPEKRIYCSYPHVDRSNQIFSEMRSFAATLNSQFSSCNVKEILDRKATLHTTEDEFTGIATVDVKSTHALSDNSTQRIEEIKNRKRRRGSHRQEQCYEAGETVPGTKHRCLLWIGAEGSETSRTGPAEASDHERTSRLRLELMFEPKRSPFGRPELSPPLFPKSHPSIEAKPLISQSITQNKIK